jgi:hypothetical protein
MSRQSRGPGEHSHGPGPAAAARPLGRAASESSEYRRGPSVTTVSSYALQFPGSGCLWREPAARRAQGSEIPVVISPSRLAPIISTSPDPMATARLGQMVTLSPRRLAEHWQPLRGQRPSPSTDEELRRCAYTVTGRQLDCTQSGVAGAGGGLYYGRPSTPARGAWAWASGPELFMLPGRHNSVVR